MILIGEKIKTTETGKRIEAGTGCPAGRSRQIKHIRLGE